MADMLTAATAVAKRTLSQLPRLTLAGWLLLATPFTVALSFMLSIGSEVQRALFSALASDAPDIYSAAYHNSITQFPSTLVWLATAFHWLYLLLAATITVLSLRASSIRNLVVLVAIWSAALLTVVDLIGLIGKFEMSALITNIAANLVGGMVIASLSGLALVSIRAITLSLKLGNTLRLCIGASLLMAFGATVSVLTYLGLRMLYQPLPARITLTLGAPTNGFYWTDQQDKPASEKDVTELGFTFLPSNKVHGGASIRSVGGSLIAQWQRATAAHQYDVEIHLLGDCFSSEVEDIAGVPVLLSKRNAKSVSVTLDEGMSDVQVTPGNHRQFKFVHRLPTFYWLLRDHDGKQLAVSHFSTSEDRLQISSSDKLVFLVGAALVSDQGGYLANKPRTLAIEVDGRSWRGTFSRSGTGEDGSRKIKCHPLEPPNQSDNVVDAQITSDAIQVAALITITRIQVRPLYYFNPETILTIRGMNGWTTVKNLEASSLERAGGRGALSVLSARGTISDLEIDGVQGDIRSHQTLTMIGEFRAEFIKNGETKVRGRARSLWKDSRRLNATRWEKLPTEWQLALLATITATFGTIGVFVRGWWPRIKALANEDLKSWLG